MQNAWLRDLELAWSLKSKKEPQIENAVSSQYVPKKCRKKSNKSSKENANTRNSFHSSNNDTHDHDTSNSTENIKIFDENNRESFGTGIDSEKPDYSAPSGYSDGDEIDQLEEQIRNNELKPSSGRYSPYSNDLNLHKTKSDSRAKFHKNGDTYHGGKVSLAIQTPIGYPTKHKDDNLISSQNCNFEIESPVMLTHNVTKEMKKIVISLGEDGMEGGNKSADRTSPKKSPSTSNKSHRGSASRSGSPVKLTPLQSKSSPVIQEVEHSPSLRRDRVGVRNANGTRTSGARESASPSVTDSIPTNNHNSTTPEADRPLALEFPLSDKEKNRRDSANRSSPSLPVASSSNPSSPSPTRSPDKSQEDKAAAELLAEAEKLWAKMIDELRASGMDIQYADLVEISQISEPPTVVALIIRYIATLLGVRTTWENTRRALFKQLFPLLKFFREVDPSTIPHRRLKKAVQIRETDLRAVTVDALGRIHVATAKLFRWLEALNELAMIILTAERKRRLLNRQPHERDSSEVVRDDGDGGSHGSSGVRAGYAKSSFSDYLDFVEREEVMSRGYDPFPPAWSEDPDGLSENEFLLKFDRNEDNFSLHSGTDSSVGWLLNQDGSRRPSGLSASGYTQPGGIASGRESNSLAQSSASGGLQAGKERSGAKSRQKASRQSKSRGSNTQTLQSANSGDNPSSKGAGKKGRPPLRKESLEKIDHERYQKKLLESSPATSSQKTLGRSADRRESLG